MGFWSGYLRWLQHPVRRRTAVVVVVSALVAAMLVGVPTPYYLTSPGSAYDVSTLVQVEGGRIPPGQNRAGDLLMLTVASQKANLALYLYGRVAGDRARLEPEQEFLGSYPSYEGYIEVTRVMMDYSRRFAAAAGLRAAGQAVRVEPVGARVWLVYPDSPAAGRLLANDLIVALNGAPVQTRDDLVQALAGVTPGDSVNLTVRRGETELLLTTPTIQHPQRGGAALWILAETEYRFDLPTEVVIAPGHITGPSAGLMFALEVYRQVTGENISGGRVIAGTGSVDPEGNVGPVGSTVQKAFAARAAGATVMLVPRANYEEVKRAQVEIELVPVATVAEAIAWLKAHPAPAG